MMGVFSKAKAKYDALGQNFRMRTIRPTASSLRMALSISSSLDRLSPWSSKGLTVRLPCFAPSSWARRSRPRRSGYHPRRLLS